MFWRIFVMEHFWWETAQTRILNIPTQSQSSMLCVYNKLCIYSVYDMCSEWYRWMSRCFHLRIYKHNERLSVTTDSSHTFGTMEVYTCHNSCVLSSIRYQMHERNSSHMYQHGMEQLTILCSFTWYVFCDSVSKSIKLMCPPCRSWLDTLKSTPWAFISLPSIQYWDILTRMSDKMVEVCAMISLLYYACNGDYLIMCPASDEYPRLENSTTAASVVDSLRPVDVTLPLIEQS